MDIGTEDNWLEGVPMEVPVLDAPEIITDPPPPRRTPDDGEPPFHTEFMELMAKYGLDDFFYVVRRADGKEQLLMWSIADCSPATPEYRPRAAGLCFEAAGLLQHMEGSTWPLQVPRTPPTTEVTA